MQLYPNLDADEAAKNAKNAYDAVMVSDIDSNDEKPWHFPEGVKLTDNEKRRVVAEVVAIGVKTLFTLHVYSFRAVSSTSELVDRSASGAPEQLPGQSWP